MAIRIRIGTPLRAGSGLATPVQYGWSVSITMKCSSEPMLPATSDATASTTASPLAVVARTLKVYVHVTVVPGLEGSAVSQLTSAVACAVEPAGLTVTVGGARMPVNASTAVTTMVTLPTVAGDGAAETMVTTGAVVSTRKVTTDTGACTLPASSVATISSVNSPSPHWAPNGPLVTSHVVLT